MNELTDLKDIIIETKESIIKIICSNNYFNKLRRCITNQNIDSITDKTMKSNKMIMIFGIPIEIDDNKTNVILLSETGKIYEMPFVKSKYQLMNEV